MNFSINPYIFYENFCTSKLTPLPHFFAMFHGNRASSYEIVAHKFRPSVAFEWQYFLLTAMIKMTEAQRWRVVSSKDSWGGYETCSHWLNLWYSHIRGVRVILARHCANPEGVKNVGKRLYPACVQRRHAYEDASVTVSWYLSLSCKLPLLEIQRNMKVCRNFDEALDTQVVSHLDNHLCCRTGHFHTRWSHFGPSELDSMLSGYTAHCEYRGPVAQKRWGGFGLIKEKSWFESDRKRMELHQTIIRQCQHHHPYYREFTLWGSSDVEFHPSSIDPPLNLLIRSCHRHVCNLLTARWDFTGCWRFTLQFKTDLCIK